ncbi:hypothetical protein [Streptomyces sp. HUAS TT7]|uniref:hypothetical protein n=1 Tax=Streptomyces sp. HUAS TT7 TaxID=3447507 RepID=UPI003F659108
MNPTTAKPGQSVTLTLRNCKNPSQGGRAEGAVMGKGATARSPIEATDLKPGPKGTLVGTATISSGARPGKADINFACASKPDAVVTVSNTVRSATRTSVTPSTSRRRRRHAISRRSTDQLPLVIPRQAAVRAVPVDRYPLADCLRVL